MSETFRIPGDQVKWCSWGDDLNGRVFRYQGEYYRGIREKSVPFFRALLERGILDDLSRKNLIVKTERTDLTLEGYPLVLRHEKIPFVSYPREWCFSMLQDAARLVIRLNRELIQHRLIAGDCHAFNVLFRGPTPVHVDVGAIVEWSPEAPYPAYQEFLSYYLYPLLLQRRKGLTRIIKALQGDELTCISREEYRGLRRIALPAVSFSVRGRRVDADLFNEIFRRLYDRFGKGFLRPFFEILSRISPLQASANVAIALNRLEKKINSIKISLETAEWTNYYEGDPAGCAMLENPSDGAAGATAKTDLRGRQILRIVEDVRPRTLIDLAGNQGLFSLAASRLGVPQVICADNDLAAIEKLYRSIRNRPVGILPVHLNIMMPGGGSRSADASERSVYARMQCEMALALAITHHLSLTQKIPFETIASTLAGYTSRHLLVEFMPWGLGIGKPSPGLPAWYTLEDFAAAFRPHFQKIEIFRTNAECNERILVVCEK